MKARIQSYGSASRCLVWFSAGAASAVAAKLALEKYGDNCELLYCDMSSDEHPDNERFISDVERWLGVKLKRLRGDHGSVDDVFEKHRYMSGIAGARCTVEMKKVPRFRYQRPTDVHVFGFTADESRRVERLREANHDLHVDLLLVEQGYTKESCFEVLRDAGIELPQMYKLGYRNNNCIGCVKATSPKYWAAVRRDFPDVFERRCKQSRDIGARLVRIKGKRMFLDEMPDDIEPQRAAESLSCGPDCKG